MKLWIVLRNMRKRPKEQPEEAQHAQGGFLSLGIRKFFAKLFFVDLFEFLDCFRA